MNHGETYHPNYEHGKPLSNVLIDALKKAYGRIFLTYEKTLTQNGYSLTEVMYGIINMQMELEVVKSEQLDSVVAET